MEKTKTKKALFMSVFSMVLCIAMLIGMTFAWFTDTASTGVNKIQAGTLDVDLEMKDASGNWVSAEGKTLQFKVDGKIPAEGIQILWEPGCTYELPELRVVNNGSLALKYKIQITGINGNAELNKVIDWTIDDKAIDLTEQKLAAKAKGDAFTIKGHMQESAGNNYQGMSIDGIAITVYATQDTVENDSYGPDYDIDAMYPIEAVASVENDNGKVKNTVTINSAATVKVSETKTEPVATATVPADTKLTDNDITKVKLVIKEADEPAGFTVEDGVEASTFDVSVVGVASDNTTPIEVKLYIGTGFTDAKLYHNGTPMNAGSYEYNAATGFITFRTATFSPFTVTYKLPPMTAGGEAYDTLEEAIAGADGAEIVLNKDVATKKDYKFSGDICIDLNGYTWTLGNNTGINNECTLKVSNGKVLGKTSSSYIDIRVGADKKASVQFTGVDFENTYKLGSKAGGSSTTYTDYVLKYNASAGDNLNMTFTDCTFKNAIVYIGGYSKGGNETVLFDNCKFNALTNSSIIEGNYYNTGTVTVKNCNFDIITTSNMTVIDFSSEKAVSLNFEGTNKFGGRVATEKDKVGNEVLKLYSTQSIKGYRAKTVTGKENVQYSGIVE